MAGWQLLLTAFLFDLLPSHSPLTWCLMALATLAGGTLRGLTGFGGALLMAPILSLAVSSRETTCLVILLNALPMQAAYSSKLSPHVDRGLVRPLFLSACVGLPAGIWLGDVLPARVFQGFIGAAVIVSAIALMSGLKFENHRSGQATFGVGTVSGILTGLAGIGGPPAILYVLAVEESIQRARATFIAYFSLLYPLGLGALVVSDKLFWQDVVHGLLLAPLLYVGDRFGERLFRAFDQQHFRPFVLSCLVCAGLVAMLHHGATR